MISIDDKYKAIRIQITTYRKDEIHLKEEPKDMNRHKVQKQSSRFMCSVCLNARHPDESLDEDKHMDCNKRHLKTCPICEKTEVNNTSKNNAQSKSENRNAPEVKTVQTSQADITQGLSLLNEVLSVFQSKKQTESRSDKSKTIILKDACVATDSATNLKSKLTFSKIFHLSIKEDNGIDGSSKFTVVNYEPEIVKSSKNSIELIKHKSSSIPQMKIDEIKNNAKEKTTSKDAIQEVKRMFATVDKTLYNIDNNNRPVTRSGPRVLPVVKTFPTKKSEEILPENNERKNNCIQNCYRTNFHLSAGDSLEERECYHKTTGGKCDKCVYMLCCQYHNRRPKQIDIVCERCRNMYEETCVHDFNNHYEDSQS